MTLRVKSCFKEELYNYRDLLLSKGLKNVSIERYMNYFDDFVNSQNVTEIVFTEEMIMKWLINKPGESNKTKNHRINWSRNFLIYLQSKGYKVCIPRRPKNINSRFQAYIFSNDEINKYFKFIDSYGSGKDPFIALCLPVIFRILYSCGTRVGETLKIKVKDVDLNKGIIILRHTKNEKTRMIPVSDELKGLLIKYTSKCLYLKTEDDYFFSHIDRRRIDEQSIYNFHRKALNDADIKHAGRGEGPRLHDLRHTFAVNSLNQFEKNGCDLYNVLPILRQFLGHSKVTDTERYLQLSLANHDLVLNKTKETTIYLLGNENEK